MKKISLTVGLFLAIFSFSAFFVKNSVSADWWERPTERPTQPNYERPTLPIQPTSPVQPTTVQPTTPPSQPTLTPGTGGPSGGGGGSTEDACASGKSYVGPYCGWSPSVSEGGGGGGSSSGGGGEAPRVGGPEVRGLSYTSGSDLALSDIILLTGILCLLLYVRSKVTKKMLA